MTTVRRKGTFRAQHAEKVGRAAQTTVLPPRCGKCRLPGTIRVMIDNIANFYCPDHVPLGEEK